MEILDTEEALQDILSKWRIIDLHKFRLFKSTGVVQYGRKGNNYEFMMSTEDFDKFVEVLNIMGLSQFYDLVTYIEIEE